MPSNNIKLDLSYKDLLGKLSSNIANLAIAEARNVARPILSNFIWLDSHRLKSGILGRSQISFSNYENIAPGLYIYNATEDKLQKVSSVSEDYNDLVLEYHLRVELAEEQFGNVIADQTPFMMFRGFGLQQNQEVDLRNAVTSSILPEFDVVIDFIDSQGVLQKFSTTVDFVIKDGYVLIYSDTSSPVINALVASNRKIRASFFQYKARIGLSQIGTGSGSGRVSVVPRNLSGTVGTQVTISDPVIKIDTETLSQQQGGVRLEVSQKDIIFRFSTANQTRTGLLTNEDWIKFDNKIDKNNFQNFSGIRSVVGLTVSSNNFQFEPYPVSTGLSPNTLVLRDNNNRFKADSPLDPQDVANKVYVDNLVAAGATYAPINAKVATNENVNLSNPPSSIDGVQLDDNDVVLVKNQNTPSQNGIYQYKVNSSGVPSLERHPSYDTSAELRLNLIFYVEQGAINGGLSFRVTKNNFGLEIEFLPVARPFSITPSNGISVTNGNVIAVNADSYSFTFLPNGKLALIDRLNITNSERTVTVQPPFSLKVNTTGIITEIQPISHNDFISSLQLVCRALNSGQASVAPNSFVHFEGEGYIPSSTPFRLRHRSFIKVHPTDSQIYFLSNPNEVPIDSGTGNLSPNQFVRHSNVHFRGTIAYKIVTVSPSSTGTYDLSSEDAHIYFFDGISSNLTVNLPSPSLCIGRAYKICKGTGGGVITILPPQGATINGGQSFILNQPYEMFEIIAVASNAWVVTSVI